jgi:glycyl-tRNA synthetase
MSHFKRSTGDLVRQLKADNASEIEVKKAVHELKGRKKMLEDKELDFLPKDSGFERARMEDLLKRRFFIAPSFEVYGGYAGQFDFGPMGCAMKHNMLKIWRNHFVLEDDLLELDCTIITPEPVLKASGHVERFADLMVKDVKNGECFRLDHLIKAHLEDLAKTTKNLSAELKQEYEDVIVRLDGFSTEEMKQVLAKYAIKSPITKNDLTDPIEFNLMFSTHIGPTGLVRGFLRPETAQGIFVNFKRLLEFNQGKLPFGGAQIGQAFRNEISPRSGLIRVREFTLAEIEYFVDPNQKESCDKFDSLRNLELNLYSACNQMDGKSPEKLKLGEAVERKIINNETLAYFMGRIHLFLTKVGVDPSRLRFRQHMSNEMAHYACDCWDAECLTSFGWVECVGCADRSCYDLTQHSKATNVKLVAEKVLPAPKTIFVKECVLQKGVIGRQFKGEAKQITDRLSALEEAEIDALDADLAANGTSNVVVNGKTVAITSAMVSVKKGDKTIHVEEITPSVIEPSFGIGRIMYSVWEHNFRTREADQQRTYFALPAEIAPIKCSILPLSSNATFLPFVKQIKEELTLAEISHKVDDSSGSIGKRYSRTDEIAIPFGITVDFDTLNAPFTVTLRERDSMEQIRLPIVDLAALIKNLSSQRLTWAEAKTRYPIFTQEVKN